MKNFSELLMSMHWEKINKSLEFKIISLFSILFFLGIWEVFSHIQPFTPILVPPEEVIKTLIFELNRGELINHILKSFLRIFIGFSLAAVIGIPLGLFMGWYPFVFQFFNGLINFLKSIPPIAWIPLAILWFGIGESSKIYIIAYSAFFPIVLNTIFGVRSIDKTLLKMAKSMGLKGYNLFKEIIFPASLPSIFTGVRIGIGTAWMALIAAEMIGATSGLGYMIEESRQLLLIPKVMLGMITIAFCGFLCDKVLEWLQKKIIPWF